MGFLYTETNIFKYLNTRNKHNKSLIRLDKTWILALQWNLSNYSFGQDWEISVLFGKSWRKYSEDVEHCLASCCPLHFVEAEEILPKIFMKIKKYHTYY